MKQRNGLLDRNEFDVTEEKLATAKAGIASKEHCKIVWNMTTKAVTLYKNKNRTCPVHIGEGGSVLFLCVGVDYTETINASETLLKRRGKIPENVRFSSLAVTRETETECMTKAADADHILVISSMLSADKMELSSTAEDSVTIVNCIIDQCHLKEKAVTVISSRLPYDAVNYSRADAIILTYGAACIYNVPEAVGIEGTSASNLLVALLAVFGAEKISGNLPIRVV